MITTPIEIDKYRNLRYDFNSIADLETVTKMTLTMMLRPLSAGSFEAVRALLWAGLKWEDTALSVRDAGELAQAWIEKSGSDVGGLTEVLIDALVAAKWLNTEPQEATAGDGQGEAIQASNT